MKWANFSLFVELMSTYKKTGHFLKASIAWFASEKVFIWHVTLKHYKTGFGKIEVLIRAKLSCLQLRPSSVNGHLKSYYTLIHRFLFFPNLALITLLRAYWHLGNRLLPFSRVYIVQVSKKWNLKPPKFIFEYVPSYKKFQWAKFNFFIARKVAQA